MAYLDDESVNDTLSPDFNNSTEPILAGPPPPVKFREFDAAQFNANDYFSGGGVDATSTEQPPEQIEAPRVFDPNGFDANAYFGVKSDRAAPTVDPVRAQSFPGVRSVNDANAVGSKDQGYLETIGKGVARGTEGLAGSIGNVVRWAGDVAGSEAVSDAGKITSDYWNKEMQTGPFAPDPEVFKGTFYENPSIKRAVGIAAEAVPSMALAAVVSEAAALVSGGAATVGGLVSVGRKVANLLSSKSAATTLGLLEGSGSYVEAKDKGKSTEEASLYGTLATVGTAILEGIGLGRIFNRAGSVLKEGAKGFLEEGGQEVTQQLWQNAIAKFGYDDTRSMAEGLIESFIGGAGVGGPSSAISAALNNSAKKRADALLAKGATGEEIKLLETSVKDQINQSLSKEANQANVAVAFPEASTAPAAPTAADVVASVDAKNPNPLDAGGDATKGLDLSGAGPALTTVVETLAKAKPAVVAPDGAVEVPANIAPDAQAGAQLNDPAQEPVPVSPARPEPLNPRIQQAVQTLEPLLSQQEQNDREWEQIQDDPGYAEMRKNLLKAQYRAQQSENEDEANYDAIATPSQLYSRRPDFFQRMLASAESELQGGKGTGKLHFADNEKDVVSRQGSGRTWLNKTQGGTGDGSQSLITALQNLVDGKGLKGIYPVQFETIKRNLPFYQKYEHDGAFAQIIGNLETYHKPAHKLTLPEIRNEISFFNNNFDTITKEAGPENADVVHSRYEALLDVGQKLSSAQASAENKAAVRQTAQGYVPGAPAQPTTAVTELPGAKALVARKQAEIEAIQKRRDAIAAKIKVVASSTNPRKAIILADLEAAKAKHDADIRAKIKLVPALKVAVAEKQVDTAPTEAQADAGNYKKGHVNYAGMDISIENPRGSVRSGTDKAGKPWSQQLNHTYGYIKGTVGKDKDHVDVFLGDNHGADNVYVVDQVDPATGKFDEHKAMIGFGSNQEARDAYLSNYQPGWKGLGAMTAMTENDFKEWVYDQKKTKKAVSTSLHEVKQNEIKNEVPDLHANIGKTVKNVNTKSDLLGSTGTIKKEGSKLIVRVADNKGNAKYHNYNEDTAKHWEVQGEEKALTPIATKDDGIVARIASAMNERAKSAIFTEFGARAVPGLRMQEHEEAGRLVYMVAKGELSQAEFDAQVEEWRNENRITEDKKPTPAEQLKAMSKEDREAMIDKAIAEKAKRAEPAPEPKAEVTPSLEKLKVELSDLEKRKRLFAGADSGLGIADNSDKYDSLIESKKKEIEALKPKPAEHLKAAGSEAAMSLEDAMKGIHKLFGGGTLNMGVTFDADRYAQAKPYFVSAWAHLQQTGKELMDFVSDLVGQFGPGIKPYLMQFMDDVDNNNLEINTDENTEKNAIIEVGGQDNDVSAKPGIPKENDTVGDTGESSPDISATDAVGGTGTTGSADVKGDGGRVRTGGRKSTRSPGNKKNAVQRDGQLPGTGTENELGEKQSDRKDTGGVSGFQRPGDFRIEVGGLKREGSWRETARRNLDIIELVKKLDSENRLATPEEQTLLSKYVGFGASEIRNNLFPGYARSGEINPNEAKDGWRDLAQRAKDILSPEELRTMAKSTQYAHYTSEGVVRSIYKALGRFGFTGGKVLEPGMGTGNFAGLMPDDMAAISSYSGIEMDILTASIARHLYQNQNIINGDFTRQKFPDNYYDLGIGNPPFSSTVILADPKYAKYRFKLHDFFFAKELDKIRPGGMLVFVTSRYTMDKHDDRARKYLSERADLIGAIRLPQTAFKENAGTEVVTDVLFLRKREKGEQPGGVTWGGVVDVSTLPGIKSDSGEAFINEYFAEHPEMILGTNSLQGSMYKANEYTVLPYDGNIEDHFEAAIEKLPKNVYSITKRSPGEQKAAVIERDLRPGNHQEGSLYVDDKGNLRVVNSGTGASIAEIYPDKKISVKDEQWLKEYVGLRDLLKQARYDQFNEKDWEKPLDALNKAYSAFVKKNGNILAFTDFELKRVDDAGEPYILHQRRYKNKAKFNYDSESAIVQALEKVTDEGVIVKSAMLQGRTIEKPKPKEPQNATEAMAISMDETGVFDIDDIASRISIDRNEAIESLGDLIYQNTEGKWVQADEFLSGNVLDRLAQYQEAAKTNKSLRRNVDALLKVQPKLLEPQQISVALGAGWIPVEHYDKFANEVLGIRNARVSYTSGANLWSVVGFGDTSSAGEWGTEKRGSAEILNNILNKTPIRITETWRDSTGTHTRLDEVATTAANDKAKKMRDAFKAWVWTDAPRATELLDIYNKQYNNIVGRTFDGSHLTLPGLSIKFKLHPHQLRAIWRVIQNGSTYLAHAVGAGKTLEMIAAGMEMKRLGMVNKPMYVVPNHMLEQFSGEFLEAYPLANLMVADEENFNGKNRKRFMAQASLNKPDAIIITHSSLKKIGIKQESITEIENESLDQLRALLSDLEDDKQGNRILIGRVERRIESMEQRFAKMVSQERDALKFEDMGVDFLFVDEAHEFRKLDFVSNQQLKGVTPDGSEKALDLYIKTSYLSKKRPGRSHVFSSGTPITNTMGELYSIMRFFNSDGMNIDGIDHFDAWSSLFGESAIEYERDPAGGYAPVERFSKFVNIPALSKRVREFMDTITLRQLKDLLDLPQIVGGGPEVMVTETSSAFKAYQKVLDARIKTSRAWKPSKDERGNPDPIINIITDGRLASIDMRFVNLSTYGEDSKLKKMAVEVIKEYHATAKNEYMDPVTGEIDKTKGATQIVFFNHGFGAGVAANRGFDARKWLMHELKTGGVNTDEVAWIDDYNTIAKKRLLNGEMNNGKKRILIGSAKKMGTGLNVQRRLAALHYLDPPWFPSDVEQPMGRIIRQGNQNATASQFFSFGEQPMYGGVKVKWYATGGSYDETMWGMVRRKAAFIENFLEGNENIFEMEDVSAVSNYAMAAALASGDNRIIHLAELQNDVGRLANLKNAHQTEQRNLNSNVVSLNSKIKDDLEYIKTLDAAWATVGDYIKDVTGAIGSKEYDNRKDLTDALRVKVNEAMPILAQGIDKALGFSRPMTLGKINGFDILMQAKTTIYGPAFNASLFIGDFKVSLAEGDDFSNSTTIDIVARAIHRVNDIPSRIDKLHVGIEQNKEKIDRMKRRIGAPFEYEQEYQEKSAESERLKTELQTESAAREVAEDDLVDNDWIDYHGEMSIGDEVLLKDGRAGEYTGLWDGLDGGGRNITLKDGSNVQVKDSDIDKFRDNPATTYYSLAPKESITYGHTSPQQLRNALKPIQQHIEKMGLNLIILNSPSELAGTPANANGAILGNTIWLFSENIGSVKDAQRIAFDELYGHHGMKLMGKEGEGFLNDLFAREKDAIARYHYSTGREIDTETVAGRQKAAEEFFAHEIRNNPEFQKQSYWHRFIAMVRRWLKNNEFTKGFIGGLTGNDIADMVRRAPGAVEKGNTIEEQKKIPYNVRYEDIGNQESSESFATSTGGISTDKGIGDYNRQFPEIQLAKISKYLSDSTRVLGVEEAAQIASLNISQKAQEHLVAIVLDGNKKVLGIIQHTIGKSDRTQIEKDKLVGAILDLNGAKSVWIAHNHPVGTVDLSDEDIKITAKLNNLLDETGVRLNGVIAVKNNEYSYFPGENGIQSRSILVADMVKRQVRRKLPVFEREIKTYGNAQPIRFTDDAVDIAKDELPNGGIVFLDGNNVPVGKLELGNPKAIRGQQQIALLRTAHTSNARGFLFYNNGVIDGAIIKNLDKFANASGLVLLDVIDNNGSYLSRGLNFNTAMGESYFYSKQKQTDTGNPGTTPKEGHTKEDRGSSAKDTPSGNYGERTLDNYPDLVKPEPVDYNKLHEEQQKKLDKISDQNRKAYASKKAGYSTDSWGKVPDTSRVRTPAEQFVAEAIARHQRQIDQDVLINADTLDNGEMMRMWQDIGAGQSPHILLDKARQDHKLDNELKADPYLQELKIDELGQYIKVLDEDQRKYSMAPLSGDLTRENGLAAQKQAFTDALKNFKDLHFLNVKNDDMTKFDRVVGTMWHLANKFPALRPFLNIEQNREEDRSEFNFTMLHSQANGEKPHEIFSLSEKEREGLRKVLIESDAKQHYETDNAKLAAQGLNVKQIEAYHAFKATMDKALAIKMEDVKQQVVEQYKNEPWAAALDDVIEERKTPMQAALDSVEKIHQKAFLEAVADLEEDTKSLREYRNEMSKVEFYYPREHGRGDYMITVRDKEGRTVYLKRTENRVAGAQIRNEILKQYPADQYTIEAGPAPMTSETIYQQINDVGLEKFVELALDKIKTGKGVTGEDAKVMRKALMESLSDELKARGWDKHMIHRKQGAVVAGYEDEDVLRVFSGYLTGLGGIISKRKAAMAFIEQLKGMDLESQQYEFAQQYVKDMLRNDTAIDRLSGKLRGAAFTWYLLGNLKSAAVQFTQNFVTGMPFLARALKDGGINGIGKAERVYGKAMADIAAGKLTDEEKAVIHAGQAKGVTADQFIQEMRGKMEGRLGGAYQRAVRFLSVPFSGMESFNRKSALLAMYRAQKEMNPKMAEGPNGYNQEAYDKSHDFVYDTHFLYGKSNLPEWARQAGVLGAGLRTSYTFRSFNHNYILNMVRSATGKDGKLALDVIGRSLAYLALFAGFAGLPWLDDLLDILERETGNTYRLQMRKALRWAGGDMLEKVGMQGLPALVGVDISGSLKMGIFGSGGATNEVFGVFGGLYDKGGRAFKSAMRGDYLRALESAAPAFVENPFKAYREYSEGARNPYGSPVYDRTGKTMKLTALEAAAQAAGFRPSEKSMQAGTQRSAKNINTHFKDSKKRLYDEMRINASNPTARASVLADMAGYNRDALDTGRKIGLLLPRISSQGVKSAMTMKPKKGLILRDENY